jgi:cytochrome c-type biogenesis protein CcmH/NrfG
VFKKLISFFRQPEVLPTITVSSVEEHNSNYKLGVELITPQMLLAGRLPKNTKQGSKNVRKGINRLQAVTAFNPSNWNAHWIIGKGYQALGEHKHAYQSFKCAYQIQSKNPNVAREYAESCMRLGYGPEAVTVAMDAVEAGPQDAGLHANLALAYLISGENSYAQRSIQYALQMAPEDQISRRVQGVINEVLAGKRRQPKTLSDL